ncbi:hypothetical protein R50073_42750 [Maricurvus nonylphenolicus]
MCASTVANNVNPLARVVNVERSKIRDAIGEGDMGTDVVPVL